MTAPAATTNPIETLKEKAKTDSKFVELLTQSLQKANELAKVELDPALYKPLTWATDFPGYIAFLEEFWRWKPQQSKEEAWTKPGTDEQQEVYDRLCHFYWLIDQEVGTENTTIIENIPWFSEWLVDYANGWGSFLDTTESFNDEILSSFINDSPEYRLQDSMIDGRPNSPSGWLTFNQFFARELNPGLRPIASPTNNAIISSPADCTFRAKYDIDADSKIPGITVKKTHKFAGIKDLLEGSEYINSFANGTFAHYFLGPYSYHRFHAPVSGVVLECRAIQGLVYLEVNLSKNQFDAPDSSEGGYEFSQARGVFIIDTSNSPYGDVGIVAVIPIGMAQVSSVNMTATVGANLLKGDEFGYFLFGGSDTIVLFQQFANPKIDTGTQYRHYGSQIATCDKV